MSPIALILLSISAVLHTMWNLLLKQASEKDVTIYWAMVVGSLFFLPLAFVGKPLPLEVLPLVLVSAALEAIYIIILAAAYRKSDFSLVYPISRGVAPALLFVWSALFLEEKFGFAGVCGVAFIICGLLTISRGATRLNLERGTARVGNLLLALLLALVISFYSLADAIGVRLSNSLTYMPVVFVLTSIFLTPFMIKRYGWQSLKAGGKTDFTRTLTIGILLLASYGLVLTAFELAPVGYTGAMRELSIIFGTLAGWLFLGESFGAQRTLGSIIIFSGILIIALFG